MARPHTVVANTFWRWSGREQAERGGCTDRRVSKGHKWTVRRRVISAIWSLINMASSSGFSKMFATPDGRTYKWKTDTQFSSPAELVECDAGRRVSGSLVTFQSGSQHGSGCAQGLGSLRIATRLLPIIDQIIVSWVIMEKERRSLSLSRSRSSSSGSSSGSI